MNKILFVNFWIAMFCMEQSSYAQNEAAAEVWYRKGLVATKAETQIEYYSNAIKLNARHANAYANRGLAKANLNRHVDAIADFDQALAIDSKDAINHGNRGVSHLMLGRFDTAIADFDKAIKRYPNYVYFYQGRGAAKMELKHYAEAKKDFDNAITLDRKNSKSYKYRSYLYTRLGQNDAALFDLDTMITLAPKVAEGYLERGVLRNNLNQYDKGIHDFDEAIQLDRKNSQAYFFRGYAKLSLKRFKTAIADLDTAIQLNPKYAKAYHQRGVCKYGLQKYEEGLADIETCISLDSTLVEAYTNRANLKLALKQYNAAKLDYEKAQQLDSSQIYIYLNQAKRAMRDGFARKDGALFEEAIHYYSQAIRLDSKNASIYKDRAGLKAFLNRYAEAIADLDTAIWIQPQFAAAYLARGVCKSSLDQFLNAIADFDSALLLNSGLTNAYGHRGACYYELKQCQKAMEDADQAILTSGGKYDAYIDAYRAAAAKQCAENSPFEKRLAIVIGNSKYPPHLSSLDEIPIHDAQDMADSLRKVGFTVLTVFNANKETLQMQLDTFVNRLKAYQVGLVFYAGHGLGIQGKNYLVPIDFPASARQVDVPSWCVEVGWIQNQMKSATNLLKTNILIIDACRDNGHLRRLRGGTVTTWANGASSLPGFITCYAALQGQSASNIGNGRNGLYTSVLLKHLLTPKQEIHTLFNTVRAEMYKRPDPKEQVQVPEAVSTLFTKFYFKF